MSKNSMLQPLQDSQEQFKSEESEQLAKMFAVIVVLMILFFMAKLVLHHFSLPVQPVEPFRYQTGVKA